MILAGVGSELSGRSGSIDLNGRCRTQQGVDLPEFLVRIGAAQAIEVLKFKGSTEAFAEHMH